MYVNLENGIIKCLCGRKLQVLFAIGSDDWATSTLAREWLQLAGVPKARSGLTLCLVRFIALCTLCNRLVCQQYTRHASQEAGHGLCSCESHAVCGE